MVNAREQVGQACRFLGSVGGGGGVVALEWLFELMDVEFASIERSGGDGMDRLRVLMPEDKKWSKREAMRERFG